MRERGCRQGDYRSRRKVQFNRFLVSEDGVGRTDGRTVHIPAAPPPAAASKGAHDRSSPFGVSSTPFRPAGRRELRGVEGPPQRYCTRSIVSPSSRPPTFVYPSHSLSLYFYLFGTNSRCLGPRDTGTLHQPKHNVHLSLSFSSSASRGPSQASK